MAGRVVSRVTSRLESLVLAVWYVVKYFIFYIPIYLWSWRAEIGDLLFVVALWYFGSIMFEKLKKVAKHAKEKVEPKAAKAAKLKTTSLPSVGDNVKGMVVEKVVQKLHGPLVIKAPICCEKCEEDVKSNVLDMEGVESVHTDSLRQKITVSGNFKPDMILAQFRKLDKRFKSAEFW